MHLRGAKNKTLISNTGKGTDSKLDFVFLNNQAPSHYWIVSFVGTHGEVPDRDVHKTTLSIKISDPLCINKMIYKKEDTCECVLTEWSCGYNSLLVFPLGH